MTEHIVAVFETDGSAAAAARALENVGVPATAIRRYETSRNEAAAVDGPRAEGLEAQHSSGGFWAWLFGQEETERSTYHQDAALYEQRARAGHVVLDVMIADDSKIHEAINILEQHHPAQIDERTEDPSASGLPGESGATTGVAPSGADYSAAGVDQSAGLHGTTATSSDSAATGSTADFSSTDRIGKEHDEVVPLAEEQIEVGKRTVDRGTTRVHRYVVEKPVEREVTLRGERVTIERRRPVDGAGTPAGAFEERTVDVRESEEVPEVEKSARVVEEVAIRREATERAETVRDRVRRDEVEVSKVEPGGVSQSPVR